MVWKEFSAASQRAQWTNKFTQAQLVTLLEGCSQEVQGHAHGALSCWKKPSLHPPSGPEGANVGPSKLHRTRKALEEGEGAPWPCPNPHAWEMKREGPGPQQDQGQLWARFLGSPKQLWKVDQTHQNIPSWKSPTPAQSPQGPRAARLPLWSRPGRQQSPAGLTHWTACSRGQTDRRRGWQKVIKKSQRTSGTFSGHKTLSYF